MKTGVENSAVAIKARNRDETFNNPSALQKKGMRPPLYQAVSSPFIKEGAHIPEEHDDQQQGNNIFTPGGKYCITEEVFVRY